jgi:predicted nucleic acid-binding protein
MENKMILLDTSILIDYYRKADKENAKIFLLKNKNNKFVISSIAEYEIYSGV